ncbi:enoyl-CoA hydratase [Iamia majanohamensis]|uniref:Enoyl-CoA hydratase n=1 Tax=Iamia majanohamensis TaxID=467976 RepID=A0AAF0BW64_9ACTN|nr:enoyl-CoA hydratase [Iamia majanohamensis]WCO67688.1 enoyl-CoA hydratase [Iamia majanohamensis]
MSVHVEPSGAVRLVTIDRPDRRNALDADHVEALRAAVADAPSGTRALVLQGVEGHFCAGADLKGIEGPEFATLLRGLLHALRDAPFPCLAALEGAVLGAGTQLAIACDLRTTTPDATLGIPAAKLGLMVDPWTVQRLVALAGQGVARTMLLAADPVSGEDAHRLGLAQRLGPPEEARSWAAEIATKAPLTIAGHKLVLNALDPPLPDDPAVGEAFDRAWSSDDLVEGKAAFAERRPPDFQGR